MDFHRLIEVLLRGHKPLLVAAAIATAAAVAGLGAFGLEEDYRLEAFVATDDPAYARFRAFMEEFTSNEFAVVAVRSDTPFDTETEAVLGDLTEGLRGLPAVQRASSVLDVPAMVRAAFGDRLFEHPLLRGNLISADRRTVAILCQMAGEQGDGALRRQTVRDMKALVTEARSAHPDHEIILTGPYVTLIDMYAYVDRDLLVFSILAFALTAVTMWAVFRRPSPMVYAAFAAACAVLCTLGITIVLGIVCSLITQMIVILVIVLCVANCVHLAVAAEETTEEGLSPAVGAARMTLEHMLMPCTAVMVTTAAGFASACISDIAPVRRFGALMAAGLIWALLLSLAGLPALQSHTVRRAEGTQRLSRGLRACAGFVLGRARMVTMVFLVALAAVSIGVTRLHFESDFVKNFRPGSEVRRSYRFIERNLSPLGSVEIVARRRDGASAATADALRAASEVAEAGVATYPMIRKALTPADALTLTLPGSPETDGDVAARIGLLRMLPGGEGILRNFFNSDGDALRINFRCVEGFNVAEKLRACDELAARAADRFGDAYEVEVTGLYYFYARLVSGLLKDQYRALGLTVVAIFAVIWVMVRSLRWTLIAMATNLAPVVFCLGLMGWADVPVNMTTAMMLSATLGIAVDDTLHYVWRFRREWAACGDIRTAIERTHRSVGRACVFTTVVITGGFSILTLSQFLPTAYFGGLVGCTMLVALVADLAFLPALIVLLMPERGPNGQSSSPCSNDD